MQVVDAALPLALRLYELAEWCKRRASIVASAVASAQDFTEMSINVMDAMVKRQAFEKLLDHEIGKRLQPAIMFRLRTESCNHINTPVVRDYYTSSTEVLSLGFSGQMCDGNDCGDQFGWSNTSGIIADTWKEVVKESCFRIRTNGKELCEKLRDMLEEPGSWVHGEEYLQGRPDSMDAPYLGYTLKRLWSVILQCSEERIAAFCPTLLSGIRIGGSKAGCRCLEI
ncbi:hypothetical protein E4T38_00536 [Aureobasidium subglaciale]|nr:hypothetical protein E4T38_00536 [Aureobasidium subglaciale]KAI5231546.1 hypothetical protein E4T40_00367 [Aureobasidium subglaciale]KAI5234270.1 hypothetical protein E4T41_00535 [Aureobasidium subglaciale]KAI5267911.1 hypothetical protein E4T46_00535 [Aureobasidium subglaciale]